MTDGKGKTGHFYFGETGHLYFGPTTSNRGGNSPVPGVQAGYPADLILVDGSPLEDIGLLASNGADISVIMRDGELIKA